MTWLVGNSFQSIFLASSHAGTCHHGFIIEFEFDLAFQNIEDFRHGTVLEERRQLPRIGASILDSQPMAAVWESKLRPN